VPADPKSGAQAGLLRPDTLSGKAWRYAEIVRDLCVKAKQPGYSRADWDEMAGMVAIDEFERVGRFKEVMDWEQSLELMDQMVRIAEFHCDLARVNEVDNMAFLELNERAVMHGETHAMTTMVVFEFNATGKITRLDFYQ
jgi:hypothetical protein